MATPMQTKIVDDLARINDLAMKGVKLENFIKSIFPTPGPIPRLKDIEIHGISEPIKSIGGDLLRYRSFQDLYDLENRREIARKDGNEHITPNIQKLYTKGGIFIADIAGHDEEAAMHALKLHNYFEAITQYEITQHGDITTNAFEQLNQLMLSSPKHATAIYGEIAEGGRFRFVNMGHPDPLVYSKKYDRFMDINIDAQAQFPPLGLIALTDHPDRGKSLKTDGKRRYRATDINLMGQGDILLLYSDGIYDGADDACKAGIEHVVRNHCDAPLPLVCERIVQYAKEYDALMQEREPEHTPDDKTVVVIKKL